MTTPDGSPHVPQLPQVGERFLGTVVKTAAFGALVSLPTGGIGLVHITVIRKLYKGRVKKDINDMIGIGDRIQVEVVEVDNRGKVSLMPVP